MRDKLNSPHCASLLKALADPDRLRIVQCLQSGPKPVGDLCRSTKSPIANVSHHLKQLRTAGLVQFRKEGRFVFYSLSPEILPEPSSSTPKILDFGCCRIELGPK